LWPIEEFQIAPDDPPAVLSAMVGVRLDVEGRLLRFDAVPPEVDDSVTTDAEPQWSVLFERAGLDLAAVTAVRPTRNALGGADERKAWEGVDPDGAGVPFTIEAGAYRGRPTYFEIVTPWARPWRMEPWVPTSGQAAWFIVAGAVIACLFAGGLLLALHNLRRGRGDRRGAFRVALFVFLAFLLEWALRGDHQPTSAEVGLLSKAMAQALFDAATFWLFYVALEPYARKIWPDILISWNRIVQGRFRDPWVGRDILIGGVTAIALEILDCAPYVMTNWLDLPLVAPSTGVALSGLEGVRQSIGLYPGYLGTGLARSMTSLLLLLLLGVVLRRRWAAATAFVLLYALPYVFGDTSLLLEGALVALWVSLMIFVLVRFGILAAISASVFGQAMDAQVYTWDLSSWYAGHSLLTLVLLAVLAGYAFHVSLAGRPLFRGDLFDVGEKAKP
jgi:hypothetical protein